ncbi:signal peptidase [Olivibacter sp. SDN3]|uniref:signal peptidase n=1 Tax=Olivibacter sp. SDN3 TaxID=2764720 RepID=UPI001651A500|nr:signal peptidase [Olivibacter sp. SDN3]QNL50103.1 signal peptidase [Olivibacter sp. SDN3]
MNKYLKRGFFFTLLGLLAGGCGLYLKDMENDWYSIILVVGVIVFGVGFVTIVYSLIRKIERKSILESREQQSQEKE